MMTNSRNSLLRFIEAQENSFEPALAEVSRGRKQSHWMWFIFPQISGLGFSETSKFYAVRDLQEAAAYLEHPLLGARLIRICNALLQLATNNARIVFGQPDDMKLQSCMTLFDAVQKTDPVFAAVLKKFFGAQKDQATLQILALMELND